MPAKRYKVDLSEAERLELEQLTHKGKISARKMKRAQILLKASAGWTDDKIAEALDDSTEKRCFSQNGSTSEKRC